MSPKNTVRGRKANAKATVQRFLPIAEIRNDTVLLKNGGVRALLEIEAVNFHLKSETEQQGIIAGYGAFVNTLMFPLQIVIRSTKANIDEYLKHLTEIGQQNPNELLRQQTFGYVTFISRLLEVADIMQKRFYVVIPVDRNVRKKGLIEQFFEWMHPDDNSGKATVRNREFAGNVRQLNERIDLVQTGLANIGLHSKRLATRDLLALYYQVYNPSTSQHQKIPGDVRSMELEETTL